jgi:hypothetical protein
VGRDHGAVRCLMLMHSRIDIRTIWGLKPENSKVGRIFHSPPYWSGDSRSPLYVWLGRTRAPSQDSVIYAFVPHFPPRRGRNKTIGVPCTPRDFQQIHLKIRGSSCYFRARLNHGSETACGSHLQFQEGKWIGLHRLHPFPAQAKSIETRREIMMKIRSINENLGSLCRNFPVHSSYA